MFFIEHLHKENVTIIMIKVRVVLIKFSYKLVHRCDSHTIILLKNKSNKTNLLNVIPITLQYYNRIQI